MSGIYKYWDTKEALSDWEKPRLWSSRFRSERHFFEKIFKPGMSVLDIGCASGDLHLGLTERFGSHEYVGVDTSAPMIERAKQLCPDAEFFLGNVIEEDLLGDRQFDVVTATGVFQHEPQYKKLLDKMLALAKDGGYVLFDCKFFHTHEKLEDISKSFCDLPNRLYFIVLNFPEAVKWIKSLAAVEEIDIFGYYSGTHKSVRLPSSVNEEVCSAHVLLKKGKNSSRKQVQKDLPEGFRL